VFLVDAMFPQLNDKLVAAIKKVPMAEFAGW
jgi:hypothetical protein